MNDNEHRDGDSVSPSRERARDGVTLQPHCADSGTTARLSNTRDGQRISGILLSHRRMGQSSECARQAMRGRQIALIGRPAPGGLAQRVSAAFSVAGSARLKGDPVCPLWAFPTRLRPLSGGPFPLINEFSVCRHRQLASNRFSAQPCRNMDYSNQSPVSPAVLIAEDDELCRSIAADAFDEAGFIVFEAAGSNEAISCLGINAGRITALFTDIHMPDGMDGMLLAQYVRFRWPWIRLAIASGVASPSSAAMPSGARFFHKPYDIARVVDQCGPRPAPRAG